MTKSGAPAKRTGESKISGGGAVRVALREMRASIGAVVANPSLRRIQLALAGSMIGDWAYATAVTVWAYGVGGVTAVGVWTAIRLTLMALTAPIASTVADRFPRKSVMIGADVLRATLVLAAAICLITESPAAPIFILATLTSLLGTPFRCAQRALMPRLARTPEELTASNGASSTIESLSFFVGPALGALLISATSIEVVFLLNVATFAWSTLLVMGVSVPAEEVVTSESPAEEDAEDESFVTQVTQGFRSIAADRDLTVVVLLAAAQTIVAGASVVFLVVMAVDILGIGAEGVGYLDSVLGIGAILGGLLAIARAGRHRLATDMTAGVVLWSLPLLLVTVWPSPAAVFAAVALLGLANPLVDVNLDTIIQRLTPDAVMGRVFGALEACLIGTMALGSFLMPVLLSVMSLRASVGVIGLGVAAVAAPFVPRMRRLNARLTAPPGLDLLRQIAMFAPLAPGTVEGLARHLVRVPVRAGEIVLSEGGQSDRFFVIESGLVEVSQMGAVIRREGPGEFFGEIGLLRDVPRTATITAMEDTVLFLLDREQFLAAVNGQHDSFLAADDIVTRRLTV
ncbi:MAG: MFS transporter [Aeromicrobium sp.]|uniref:MFS transporter n=1 Tax=Aeromicrobium sp. TaxID=1871063 RepID=UPI003C4AC735